MTKAILFSVFVALAFAPAHAGTMLISEKAVAEATPPFDPFEAGRFELQLSAGYFGGIKRGEPARPELNDVDGSLRLGWMLTSPRGDGFFRGNTEFMIAGYGAGIVEGPGSYLAGAALVLRYNFVQPDALLVPYVQLETGGVKSDAHEDQAQRLIGSEYSFHLGAAIGMRIFCSERCSISLEAAYRHISNAGLADRNLGADSLGGWLGVSWFF